MTLRHVGPPAVLAPLSVATLIRVSAAQDSGSRLAPSRPPAGPGTAQPQLSVSERGVILRWIERAGNVSTLKFAERRNGSWSSARTVSSGTDWFVNRADVPTVVRLADGTCTGCRRAAAELTPTTFDWHARQTTAAIRIASSAAHVRPAAIPVRCCYCCARLGSTFHRTGSRH